MNRILLTRHGRTAVTVAAVIAAASLALGGATAAQAATPAGVLQGTDVSYVQGNDVDYSGQSFAFVKATQGTAQSNVSTYFANQYSGAAEAGLVRGAYHYADPLASNGTVQATWFLAHGGNWSPDSRTLPPTLDLENSTSGKGDCFGLPTASIVRWISDFTGTMKAKTGVDPIIYTTPAWWKECTGNTTAFSADPLFYVSITSASTPGAMFGGWKNWTFWQYKQSPRDADYFNGNSTALAAVALGTPSASTIPAVLPSAGSTLAGVTSLAAGQSLSSDSGQYKLTLQGDGNLVMYGNGHAVWSTGTKVAAGAAAPVLKLQDDGNVVLYSGSKALWSAGTNAIGGAPTLALGNDGDLVVRSQASGAVYWRTKAPGSDNLVAGGTLTAGQYLHSATSNVQFTVQSDGNVVAYVAGVGKWSAGTRTQAGVRLTLQADGNLVAYNSAGAAVWNSKTNGKGGTHLVVQSDGNVVLYTAAGKAVWASGS